MSGNGSGQPVARPFRVAGLALCALFLTAGCRTTGPIAESSTDFRLQNIEAALVKIQGEVKALESRQAEGDKTWGEVRAKLDELTQLLRARSGEAAPAAAQTPPPPWAGQASAQSAPPAAQAPAQTAQATAAPPSQSASDAKGDRQPVPYSRWAKPGKDQPQAQSDVGRPFPAVPPGQTAQAVQAASTASPTPPPPSTSAPAAASPPATTEPATPAAELAAMTPPAPLSAASPGGNPAKAWDLPGPDAASSRPMAATPAAPQAVSPLSPYPAVLPPAGGPQAQTAPSPVATAVQGPLPEPGPAPASPAAPAPAAPTTGKPSAVEEADYNRALKLALNGKPREAKAAFGEFLAKHPQSALSPNVRYWIGESDYIQGNMTQAAQSFGEVSKMYPGHHKAADSLYKLGMVEEKLGDTAAARAAYEALVKDYPSSELAGNARRKLEQLPR